MTWQAFLSEQHARFDADGSVADFGDGRAELAAALDGNALIDLSAYALIEARGDDAQQFLQGQFTADVRQVTATHSQLSAWCSPKGRILVNFRLFQGDGAYYLWLPRPLLAGTLKRLQMFVLRAKVQLREATELTSLCLSGPDSAAVLAAHLDVPEQIGGVARSEGLSVIRLAAERFLAVAETARLQGLWEQYTGAFRPAGFAAWRLQEILAGVPWIGPQTADAFVPQMLNYEALGGLSFNKGCYTGQEIVARSQYLGTLKRHCYRATLAVCPDAGAELSADGEKDSAGKIVGAAPHPAGGFVCLAVLKDAVAETQVITCGTAPLHDLARLA